MKVRKGIINSAKNKRASTDALQCIHVNLFFELRLLFVCQKIICSRYVHIEDLIVSIWAPEWKVSRNLKYHTPSLDYLENMAQNIPLGIFFTAMKSCHIWLHNSEDNWINNQMVLLVDDFIKLSLGWCTQVIKHACSNITVVPDHQNTNP